jgi:hypothetical protein
VTSGAVRDLVGIMGGEDDDSEEAAWVLIHLVDAGTKGHIQHAVNADVLPKFVVLLEASRVDIRKETTRVLAKMGNVVFEGWREPLWDSGAIDALITLLQQEADDDVLHFAARAVNSVCEDEPDEARIRFMAPTLAQLLYYHDGKVLGEVCRAFSSCLKVHDEVCPGRVQTIVRMGVCRRLVELLRYPHVQLYVMSNALRWSLCRRHS